MNILDDIIDYLHLFVLKLIDLIQTQISIMFNKYRITAIISTIIHHDDIHHHNKHKHKHKYKY